MRCFINAFIFLFKLFIISTTVSILQSPIEYLKGVGPLRADLLKKELNIFTFFDLLNHFPLRHVDKTKVDLIGSIQFNSDYIQVAGRLEKFEILGEKRSKRLVAHIRDKTGILELTWFQGINWIQKSLLEGQGYLVFGKVSFFNGKPQIVHPEIEVLSSEKKDGSAYLEPIYPSTEKLKVRGLNGRQIAKLTFTLFTLISKKEIPENIPDSIKNKLKLADRFTAYSNIHFPKNNEDYQSALQRLKFEELFISQVRLNILRLDRYRFSKGILFEKVGSLFNNFYKNYIPFELTNAQKRVIKEIRTDTAKGFQMNRLLQGDVGSGKTMVALLSLLLAVDNGYQGCLMAPTEILAQQHFNNISELLKDLPVSIALLTGSTKSAQRKKILAQLENNGINILIGTHALIEKTVQFNKLGLAVVDEQHKFGVEQRAKLWKKNTVLPHILVMTATPIPRTLAMTAFGDLDYSIIDELPPGRIPITTVHRNEMQRMRVMAFVEEELIKGRQAYFIYPLIEESEKLDFENLMEGYEQVKTYFPEHKYKISMLHGKMPTDTKETNMRRFVENNTQIMVSTTVIEVGVNVSNASIMIIESAEKFGLSQLHQLRGRVGRGSEKSFCILLTGSKMSNDARQRIHIMCESNDGFLIAEKDLELRGPGDIEGTRQSGVLNFKLASIVNDKNLLETAKKSAEWIIKNDPDLTSAQNLPLKDYMTKTRGKTAWSKIS